MKICIVLDSLIRAGAERQAVLAIEELTRQGRDATLIYYNTATYAYDPPAEARDRIHFLPKRGHKLRFLWRLYKYFKLNRFDVVHGFLGGTTIYVALAGRMARVPVVFGGIRAEYDCTGIIRFLHRRANRHITGWIVNSQATVRSMLPGVGATPDRVHVVYNGIDPARFDSKLTPADAKTRLGLPHDAPVVTLIGRLTPQKNVPLFLEVASRLKSQWPNVQCLIVGDGELRGELERMASARSLQGMIHFLGMRTDIPDILRATDVLTLTSHYEGLSNTLLEAMSVGLPVVSTAYAGVEELLTDGVEGYVVPRDDADAMTRRLVELLGDESLRRRMGGSGRRRVSEHFTIPAMASRLWRVYEKAHGQVSRANHPGD